MLQKKNLKKKYTKIDVFEKKNKIKIGGQDN